MGGGGSGESGTSGRLLGLGKLGQVEVLVVDVHVRKHFIEPRDSVVR